MVFSSERKRFLFMSLGSNICLFSVDHHFVHFVCGDVATTSLCLLARTAAHQCSASCGPEKQHSFGGEGFRNGARAVSVGEEQFLAMQLSDSLHQTFVFGSSCVLVRAWERVAGSARSERGLMSSRPHLRGAAKRYTRCSHHVDNVGCEGGGRQHRSERDTFSFPWWVEHMLVLVDHHVWAKQLAVRGTEGSESAKAW